MARLSIVSLLAGFVLSACSQNKKPEATSSELKNGRIIDLQQNNVFAWDPKDVERGDDGSITGGKRSRYDGKAASAFSKSGKAEAYMNRRYHSDKWTGSKDFSTGSYETQSWNKAKNSRWAGKKSREAGRQSRNSGKNYRTGNYATRSARERSADSFGNKRSQYDGKKSGWKPNIYSLEEYRALTINQTRSLLGKD